MLGKKEKKLSNTSDQQMYCKSSNKRIIEKRRDRKLLIRTLALSPHCLLQLCEHLYSPTAENTIQYKAIKRLRKG